MATTANVKHDEVKEKAAVPEQKSAVAETQDELTAQGAESATIEADDETFSDYDDASSRASSTQSLSSSIKDHVYANGRMYHRKSSDENEQYFLPADETEFDRLDMAHHLMLLILDGELHKAPIKNDPANVLDCGTGTGIWALDFGSIHPGSKVIGVDLAPNQPTWTYPNVVFETDDLEKEWTYRKNHFDFIHSRMVGSAIRDWGKYTRQMYKHAAPGAYVELSEHSMWTYSDDNTQPPDSISLTYFTNLTNALSKINIHTRDYSSRFFRSHLEAAGFVDIQVFVYKVPWGTWPKSKKFKHMGAVCAEVCKTGIEAYGLMAMTRLLGMAESEARAICTEFVDTMYKGKEHIYHLQWQVVARKPAAGEA